MGRLSVPRLSIPDISIRRLSMARLSIADIGIHRLSLARLSVTDEDIQNMVQGLEKLCEPHSNALRELYENVLENTEFFGYFSSRWTRFFVSSTELFLYAGVNLISFLVHQLIETLWWQYT